ncbi:exonuclease SbcC [Microbacterium foliorum]|uniref:Nuclease SbcCD subunit C n=1 Tax=Microbacterium foliorum TaxID=104336 RepID=A0ABU1HVD7_9MICO|nr:AAA family ATPase [Microbacterium foliorum]MDR6144009.1 exonuclease SbcC [Microbacterium foliorum]
MRLKSLELTNFRSIRGSVRADLDASVVLIHGPNGAGKTSLMSAIELGLTGSVSSLVGFGDEYGGHLLHSGTTHGSVELLLGDGRQAVAELSADQRGPVQGSLLTDSESEFLRERAYLAQSTMARLLESYEQSDRRGDSALTRFVNELLGLDELDALISGLEPARDVRRARKLVPELQDVGDEVQHLETRLEQARIEWGAANQRSKSIKDELQHLPAVEPLTVASSRLVAVLAQLDTMSSRLEEVSSSEASNLVEVEARLRDATERVERWRGTSEPAFRALLAESVAFADADLELSAEPTAISVSLKLAENLIASALEDARSRLAAHNLGVARLVPLREQIEAGAVALGQINEEIAEVTTSGDSGRLAEALALLVPHVETDECPVCGRDFGEVSKESLRQHLAERVTALGVAAKSIETLGARRTQQRTHLDRLVLERERIEKSLEAQEAADALAGAIAFGNNLLARINGSHPGVESLEDALTQRSKLEAVMSQSLAASETLERLRRDLAQVESEFVIERRHTSKTSFSERLSEVRKAVESLRVASAAAEHAVDSHRSLQNDLSKAEDAVQESAARRDSLEKRLKSARARLQRGSERVELAARLSKRSVALRAEIVERVFDSTLNGTWRDLFTRLAPEEPFVPEFIAAGASRSGVQLQAVHKKTKAAGAPGLVLSAGNLNTAALTLFLALNATAKNDVDLLLLDDPVQAMDDVHVSQFSALMRSFTRDLGKQVVVAVHERALFEYLALELSPTKQGDALITIELERAVGLDTQSQVSRVEFEPDPLEAGLSAA